MAKKSKTSNTQATARIVRTQSPLKKKASKKAHLVVRRSSRLRSLASPSQSRLKDIALDPIDLSESENEEEQCVEQGNSGPSSDSENNDHLDENVNKCMFKENKRSYPGEPLKADITYKSLYIDSQKKVEALLAENLFLAKKLEFSAGKVEAYENMKEAMGNLKDMIFVSGLGRVTEAVVNLSSQATCGKCHPPDASKNAAEPVPDSVNEPRGGTVAKMKKCDAAEPVPDRGTVAKKKKCV